MRALPPCRSSLDRSICRAPAGRSGAHPPAPTGKDGHGEVIRSGDMIILPLTFGRSGTLPDRIDLKCLNGKLTSIRYRREGDSQTFRVVNEQGNTRE